MGRRLAIDGGVGGQNNFLNDLFTGPLEQARNVQVFGSDAVKGRLVAESMIPGVSVREVAERNGLMPNRLSSWRGLAKRGILVVPDLAGADFVSIVLEGAGTVPAIPTATPFLNSIELETGGVALRLDANTSVSQIADLVSALRSAS